MSVTPDTQYVGGLHAVSALIKSDPGGIDELLILQGRRDKRMQSLLQMARAASVHITAHARDVLDGRFGSPEHQGVVARYHGRPAGSGSDLVEWLDAGAGTIVLVLDQVQDPHNLGACLRNADATGVDAVVIPGDHASGLTPTVRKVACGAAETVRVFQVVNLPRTLKQLQDRGFWVYGAASEGNTELHAMDFSGPVVLVVGAEGQGLRRLTREHCDGLFRIPMRGTVESLNVSVAAGVILYEVMRQRDLGA